MEVVLLLLIISLFFKNVYEKLKYTLIFSKYKNIDFMENGKNKTNKKIYVLIPVYNEETIINSTIDYFFSNIKEDNIEIYFITTNKELINGKNKTLDILEKNIDSKQIINYPFEKGDKGHQLNYAIELLSNMKNNDLYNSYFSIFDADSKPDIRGLYEVLNDRDNEKIYQMLAMYNANFHHTNLFGKANALIQSRRSIYFEKYSLLQNYKQKNKLMYLIGHGLFIRGDIAKKYPFPENSITEDIVFGYKLNLNGIYAKPLNYFDYSTVPNELITTVNQTSRWLIGEYDFILNLLFRKKNILAFKRLIQLIQWGTGGFFILTLIIISILNSYNILIIMIIIAIISDYLSLSVIYHKYFKLDNRINLIGIYIASLVKNILDIIPTIISLISVGNKILLHKKYVFIKTPR